MHNCTQLLYLCIGASVKRRRVETGWQVVREMLSGPEGTVLIAWYEIFVRKGLRNCYKNEELVLREGRGPEKKCGVSCD